MAHEIYYHKQQPSGMAESPDTNLSVTQSAQVDKSTIAKGIIGITTIAKQVVPAVKQVGGALVNATGNSRLKKKLALLDTGITLGASAYALGVPIATSVFLGSALVTEIGLAIDERGNQIDQEYNRTLLGSATEYLNIGGAYLD